MRSRLLQPTCTRGRGEVRELGYLRCASTNQRYLSTLREISVKISALSLSPSECLTKRH